MKTRFLLSLASDWSHLYSCFGARCLRNFEPQWKFLPVSYLCLGTTAEPQPDRQFNPGPGSEEPDQHAIADQGPQVGSRDRKSGCGRGRQRRAEDADLLQCLGHARDRWWNGRDHPRTKCCRDFDRGYLRRESQRNGLARRRSRHVEPEELAEKHAAVRQSGRQDVQKISILNY